MAYEFDAFIAEVRETLRGGSGPAQLEAVRTKLSTLLHNADFVERTCGAGAKGGLHRMHVDPEFGFEVLAHINDKPRCSPPHDHGKSWAVYGQATGYTDMTEYRRVDDGTREGEAKLEVLRQYRLNPGEVGVYNGTQIHAIDYPERSRFIRITGTNLDRIDRLAFDLETGKIKQMAAQQAS